MTAGRWILTIAGAILFLGSALVSIVTPASGLVAPLAIGAGVAFTSVAWLAFAPVWRSGGGRGLSVAAAAGLLLIFAAILASLIEPATALSVPFMIVAGILLAGVMWAVFAAAWQTKGWSLRHPGRED